MYRSLIAFLLAAAPAAGALAEPAEMGGWDIATMPNGCMVQAVSPQGTMISIWGFAGQRELGFLLQDPDWNMLNDGQHYPLQVEFAEQKSWPVEATARAHIDKDGPGFYFTMEPGQAASNGFLAALTSSQGMQVRQDGRSVATLPLAGSRAAMGALARCLSERWSVSAPQAPPAEEGEAPAPDTI